MNPDLLAMIIYFSLSLLTYSICYLLNEKILGYRNWDFEEDLWIFAFWVPFWWGFSFFFILFSLFHSLAEYKSGFPLHVLLNKIKNRPKRRSDK